MSIFTTFAETLNQKTMAGTTEIEYSIDATYTVTIPAYIVPAETNEDAEFYSITASNVVIEDGKELKTSISYDGVMTDTKGAELEYAFYFENEKINDGDIVLKQVAGTPDITVQTGFTALTVGSKYAGVFTDTVTFNISIETKTYTLDEIDTDEHMYAIGKTQPEYVVAKFNEDYTSVDIIKNGENSDGLMMNFDGIERISPMYIHRATLTSAIIKDGVIERVGNDI